MEKDGWFMFKSTVFSGAYTIAAFVMLGISALAKEMDYEPRFDDPNCVFHAINFTLALCIFAGFFATSIMIVKVDQNNEKEEADKNAASK